MSKGGQEYLYVGKTGDTSSPNAAPPFPRLAQHLSANSAHNSLRANLVRRGVEPESCESFEMIAHGPIFPEQEDMKSHKPFERSNAALEMKLAYSLSDAGYDVLNIVNSHAKLDVEQWHNVRQALAERFPKLLRI